MDHDAICDCPFQEHCQTHADPLVDEARKGPEGMGCTGANDHHRQRHCKAFACQYLAVVFSDLIRSHAT